MNIHPSAIVSHEAQIGPNVTIGPFAVVEADVVIGEGCQLASHVVVKDGTRLGPNTIVHEAAILGGFPQHLNKPKRPGLLVIGANNTIREHAILHRAMKQGAATTLGDNNYLMGGVHIAHDCRVGENVIFANNALLGGSVIVEDRAFVSGAVGVHQFCRIGRLAMVGVHAKVLRDVPPYVTVDGTSGRVVGLNLFGLRRNGFTTDDITRLKMAYRLMYRSGLKWSEVLEQLKTEFPTGPAAIYSEFLSGSIRGFVRERRTPQGAAIKLHHVADDARVPIELRTKAN